MIFVGSVIIIMRRSVVLLAAVAVSIPGCDGHGFLTNPVSRNTLVCDKLWPDYLKVGGARPVPGGVVD